MYGETTCEETMYGDTRCGETSGDSVLGGDWEKGRFSGPWRGWELSPVLTAGV